MKSLILTTALAFAMPALALAAQPSCTPDGPWQSMDTAPKNGVVIEIMNTYGIAPWYGLFKWSATQQIGGPQDPMKECDNSPSPYELYPQHSFMGFTWGGFTQAEWDDWSAKHCADRKPMTIKVSPEWVGVGKGQVGGGVDCNNGDACHWRPYCGSPDNYTDPTNGAQQSEDYWRQAAGMH